MAARERGSSHLPRIPPAVARKLGNYVYLYSNPLDDSIFYVGKGRGNRALAHLNANERKEISKKIEEIRAAGREPDIEILAHGLPNTEAAHRVEAAAIDLLGLDNLVNAVRGHGVRFGRMPIGEVVAHYTRRKAKIREPTILIRINLLYRYGMSPVELYDATRSAWKVGSRADQAELAMAVFDGVVREVYQISEWLEAGTTFNTRKDGRGIGRPGRWEFVGILADDHIRKRYVNRYVGHLFSQGAQNPISYVNID